MPLIKKIIKSGPREVIVKWVGAGTDTLTLASLVSGDQTLDGVVQPTANILSVTTSISGTGTGTIVRNSEEVLSLSGNFKIQEDGVIHAVLDENSTFPIVVNLSTPGTLIIRLKKMQGYTGI